MRCPRVALGKDGGASLRARARDGRTGEWIGGLYASPGGAGIETRARWAPDEQAQVDVIVPTARRTEYVEVDDARGRAWAAALDLAGTSGDLPRASVRVPRLRSGLYWAVAASDPDGAARLGPGTTVRPFFVAPSDREALALRGAALGCEARLDPRDVPRALWPCLATAGARTAARWTALDGLVSRRAADLTRRARGRTAALAAVLIAALLEGTLLLRAAVRSRAGLVAALGDEPAYAARPLRRAGQVTIALLVALLGFALLAALLARAE